MLSKPKHGWCDITIGDFTDRASYLTPVHLDILKSLCNLCQTHKPQTVFVDAEGWEYYIVFDCYSTFVILCKEEKPEVFEFDIYYKKLAKEVINDIRDNLDDWADWEYDAPCNINHVSKYGDEICLWFNKLSKEVDD